MARRAKRRDPSSTVNSTVRLDEWSLGEDESELTNKQSDIFPTISVARVRSILARVQTIDYTIPSIHTFLEDTKIPEPCAKIMKKLLPSACRTSILQEFGRLQNGQTSWSLQISEVSCYRKEEDSSDTAHKNAYRQLWLYTIRHFPEMIGQPLRKDLPRARSLVLGVELIWWYKFTALAEACGYAELDKTYHRGWILPPAGQHEYLVSDEGRDKRIKITDARSIPNESVVLIGDHGLIVDYDNEYLVTISTI